VDHRRVEIKWFVFGDADPNFFEQVEFHVVLWL
jgi:hypothetical protein